MAKYRAVNTKFWDDTYILSLDPIEKLVFLYIITNPLTNICGIYEIAIKRIAFDTGLDKEMAEKILMRFERDRKAYYIEGWIGIVNFVKNQSTNPKVVTGIEAAMAKAPEKLKSLVLSKLLPIVGYQTLNTKHKTLNIRHKTRIPRSADAGTDWVLKNEIEKCITDKRRHVQVIGVWIKHTGLAPENIEQLGSIIKRYSKPALLLKGYSNEDIEETIETLKNTDYLKKYTIETVLKFIDKVVANKVKRGPKIVRWDRVTKNGKEYMAPVYEK